MNNVEYSTRSVARNFSVTCLLAPAFLLAAVTASADEVTPYVLDDGTASYSYGIGTNGVIVNEFVTQAGFETISGVEIVFGQGLADSINLVIYSDPNNDGIFNDAVLEYFQPAARPLVGTGEFETVAYNFVTGITFSAGDVFYIGAEEIGNNIGIAADAAGGLSTWAAFTGRNPATAGTVNVVSFFGGQFARDGMIRALVAPAPIPEPATFAVLGGLAALGLAVGGRRRVR